MFQGIWLSKEGEISLRSYEELWKPAKGEVLVKVMYSGINPADIKHGRFGFNECVSGYDFAGTIVELGKGMNDKFQVGDLVCGLGAPMLEKPPKYGSHQDYHIARDPIIHKIPAHIKAEEASTMPVVVYTAADGLFNQLGLSLSSKEQNPILIWGGAGAVGSAAIQLAKAASCYPIITTASPKNHETLLSLGADFCLDYRAGDVEAHISAAMEGKKFSYIFDCVVAAGTDDSLSSTAICENLSSADGKCCGVTPAIEPKKEWPRVFACRNADVDFALPDGRTIVHKANLQWQAKMDEAFLWALENYGKGFVIPNVKVVVGTEKALEALRLVAGGKASFQKLTIQHPL